MPIFYVYWQAEGVPKAQTMALAAAASPAQLHHVANQPRRRGFAPPPGVCNLLALSSLILKKSLDGDSWQM